MSRALAVGQVVTLGRHRLKGAAPHLIFTSPPYAQQRRYVSGIGDWDALMQRVFSAARYTERTQVLVNLGLVHRGGEWVDYWRNWATWMSARGWRRFGWYVWSKGEAVPGNWNGRLPVSHEFILHFNRQARTPNKTVACKPRKDTFRMTVPHLRAGQPSAKSHGQPIGLHRAPFSVLTITPDKANRTGHPAVFPVALPAEIMRAYTDPGEVVYEPFAGSGTSLIAAEQQGRTCYAMEIEPSYCAMAAARYRKACAQPTLPGAA